MELLKVRGLTKRFDDLTAVADLSFSLDQGTIVGLIGPNGAGKSTVFNILLGTCEPDKGQVYFDGKKTTGWAPHRIARLGVGRTFQSTRVFPQMSVLENLMLAPHKQSGESLFKTLVQAREILRHEKEVEEKATGYLKTVGLLHKKDAMAGDLSHGQRKLLELARALAIEPKLLLLDEPTAGVYSETRGKMMKLFQGLRDAGKAILFIEHDRTVVSEISDKVIVLNAGKKIAEGPPAEIRRNKDVALAYWGDENGTA